MKNSYLSALLLLFAVSSFAQKEIDLVNEVDGSHHKLVIEWDEPADYPKWQALVVSPGFLVTNVGALSNRFEALATPIDKLDLQARLTIPYVKKTDFGRDDNQYLPEQGKSTLSYSFKAHYSVLSFNKQKIRKTQVGGSGNIAYVAHIPRTVRTSIQLTAGYDYLRTPSNYQIDLLSEMDTIPAMTGNFFHMNPAFGNLVFWNIDAA